MAAIQSKITNHPTKIKYYWALTKPLQTGLLLATGVAGYLSARCPISNIPTNLGLVISLFLSIAGSTVLNMWWDRDIDAKMRRTQNRATSSGAVDENEALRIGLILAIIGVGWAVAMDALYGLVVFAGLFFDVVVYSMWLKRRTCWGIVWGGISGAMPILAGRVLGLGGFDCIHPRDHRCLQRAGGYRHGRSRSRHRHGLGLPAPARCALGGPVPAGAGDALPPLRARQFWTVQVRLGLHVGCDDPGCN